MTTHVHPKAAGQPRREWITLFLALYILMGGLAAWQIILHSLEGANDLKESCQKSNYRNQSAQVLGDYQKHHPLISVFLKPPIEKSLDLPEQAESSAQLDSSRRLLEMFNKEVVFAGRWSYLFLAGSALLVSSIIVFYGLFQSRYLLFAFTTISAFFFIIGITAPAIAIVTSPSFPIMSQNLAFVQQCEVRSLSSVIAQLFINGLWAVAGLITIFGVVTPVTKFSLTFIAAKTRSPSLQQKLHHFLSAIGKWSMTDVFVAAVLLALFAVKNEDSTKAMPGLGLYFFAGYCLLSMATTIFVSSLHANRHPAQLKSLGMPFRKTARISVGLLWCILPVFAVTLLLNQPRRNPALAEPLELSSVRESMPAHRWMKQRLTVPQPGTLVIDIHVASGNAINVALIPRRNLPDLESPGRTLETADLIKAGLTNFVVLETKLAKLSGPVEKGQFLILVNDTTLGVISASTSEIEIHAYLLRETPSN